jgi:hypothetical protein
MRTYDEWCTFFANIELDPKAITPRLTIRDMLAARAHIGECQTCADSVDRVLDSAPPENPMNPIGFN